MPQGGVISPLLSNVYLNDVDRMLERAKRVTRYGSTSAVEYVRYADDLVVLVHEGRRWDWVLTAVQRRLREELAKLQVEVNEEKSRVVDLCQGASFGFLGFDIRRVRSRWGRWRPLYTPQLQKRTALLRKLRDIFHRYRSQPVSWVVRRINPILRGWVTYFAVGQSSRCFSYISNWVEVKLRRHWAAEPEASGLRVVSMALAAGVTHGGGLPRLSRPPVSSSSRCRSIGPITSDTKSAGKRSARNLHAPFEVAGVGNGLAIGLVPRLPSTLLTGVTGHAGGQESVWGGRRC